MRSDTHAPLQYHIIAVRHSGDRYVLESLPQSCHPESVEAEAARYRAALEGVREVVVERENP